MPSAQILHGYLTQAEIESESSRGLLQIASSYGTFSDTAASAHQGNVLPERQESAFANFFVKLKRLIPFIWPKKKPWLQFLIYICVGLLILGRLINVLVPYQLKVIIDSLGGSGGEQGEKDFFFTLLIFG